MAFKLLRRIADRVCKPKTGSRYLRSFRLVHRRARRFGPGGKTRARQVARSGPRYSIDNAYRR